MALNISMLQTLSSAVLALIVQYFAMDSSVEYCMLIPLFRSVLCQARPQLASVQQCQANPCSRSTGPCWGGPSGCAAFCATGLCVQATPALHPVCAYVCSPQCCHSATVHQRSSMLQQVLCIRCHACKCIDTYCSCALQLLLIMTPPVC